MSKFLVGRLVLLSSAGIGSEVEFYLSGTVFDEMGDAPIPNLNIFSDSRGTLVATTDQLGNFQYPVRKEDKMVCAL